MANEFQCRPAQPEDRAACYRVCLKTSDNGADGSHLQDDPDALGHVYVGAYLQLEPACAIVLEDETGVCGYCLGAPDSAAFWRRFVTEWLPPLQRAIAAPSGDPAKWTPTQQLHHLLHEPAPLIFYPPAFAPWPAHAHIDLLPRAHGHGWGRRLMEMQMELLRKAGAPGLHLCVGAGNTRAHAFYRKLGFDLLDAGHDTPPDTVFMVRRL